jgi:hypothetical protein
MGLQIVWSNYLALLTIQLLLALVYLLSFSTKARNPRDFLLGVEAYGILGRRLATLYGSAVIGLELFLSLSHFTGYLFVIAVPLGVGLLSSFLLALVIAYRKNKGIACHCFGGSETVSIRSILRLVLALFAELLLLTSPGFRSWYGHWNGRVLSPLEMSFAIPYASMILISAIWLFSVPELTIVARAARSRDGQNWQNEVM